MIAITNGEVWTITNGVIKNGTVLIEDGLIVRLEFNPGWPPFELVWGKSDKFILSPIR